MELMETYYNANHAFNSLRADIIDKGIPFANTKALFNIGFYLQNPLDNKITNKERNWKEEYAEAEWQWYLSKDRDWETILRVLLVLVQVQQD